MYTAGQLATLDHLFSSSTDKYLLDGKALMEDIRQFCFTSPTVDVTRAIETHLYFILFFIFASDVIYSHGGL